MKLVGRQFPAFQNQDDRQAGIFGRHLPAAGRQIRALKLDIGSRALHHRLDNLIKYKFTRMYLLLNV